MSLSTCVETLENTNIAMMTIRKPTELKKIISCIPKPTRAVPKDGLPMWYKLPLDSKLPIPKIPQNKIVYSCGRIGENIRKAGLGTTEGRPSFDLSDPYGYRISNAYESMHDPNLTPFFFQRHARERMKEIGFCTEDNQAICSLKEFNQYRLFLYKLYLDRIHVEMDRIDQKAKDDLTLTRVDRDVDKKELAFNKTQKLREKLEKLAQQNADALEEKRQAAINRQKLIKKRMRLLAELNEKRRKERVAKSAEKARRLQQRVKAAKEIELKRKIYMIRNWRSDEKRRVQRLKMTKEMKLQKKTNEIEASWQKRIESQNKKIAEEECLLKLYTYHMETNAKKRAKNAEIYAYKTDLELQRIRMTNLRLHRGGTGKTSTLIRKMGIEFEKSKRGAKGMSRELAQTLAEQHMKNALSTKGDGLMILGQARGVMEIVTAVPPAPISVLEEALQNAIVEFTRRRVHVILTEIERQVYAHSSELFLQKYRKPAPKQKINEPPRWSAPPKQVTPVPTVGSENQSATGKCLRFGEVTYANEPDNFHEGDMKSCKFRTATPMPSMMKLVDYAFSDRVENLPDPTVYPHCLPERKQLLKMIAASKKILYRDVDARVVKGLDLITFKVTLPRMKHQMEWGEAIECLVTTVIEHNVSKSSPKLQQTGEYLAHRILKTLTQELRQEKKIMTEKLLALEEKKKKKREERKIKEKKKADEAESVATTESGKM